MKIFFGFINILNVSRRRFLNICSNRFGLIDLYGLVNRHQVLKISHFKLSLISMIACSFVRIFFRKFSNLFYSVLFLAGSLSRPCIVSYFIFRESYSSLRLATSRSSLRT